MRSNQSTYLGPKVQILYLVNTDGKVTDAQISKIAEKCTSTNTSIILLTGDLDYVNNGGNKTAKKLEQVPNLLHIGLAGRDTSGRDIADQITKHIAKIAGNAGENGIKPANGLQTIADSGFRPSVDGFNFANFSTTQSKGGVCYGFSLASKLIFENFNENDRLAKMAPIYVNNMSAQIANLVLELELEGKPWDIPLELSEQLRKGNTVNLSDPKIVEYLGTRKETVDSTRVYPSPLADHPWINITTWDVIPPRELDGATIVSNQTATLNPYVTESPELARLISQCSFAQVETIVSNNLINPTAHIIQSEENIKPLIENIENGQPAMLSMQCTQGGHSVLCYKIDQDIADPRRIILYLYDSNNPGQEQKATIMMQNSLKVGTFTGTGAFEYIDEELAFDKMALETDTKLYSGTELVYSDPRGNN